MNEYYSRRAEEYENIYHRDDPIRQDEQNQIKNELKRLFAGKSVLEIACGTGYWTESIAEVSRKITGIDVSREVLEIAKSKNIPAKFMLGDAFNLEKIEGNFNAGCANFWFSHIEKDKIDQFLNGFHKRIGKNSSVFMADNIYVEGIGGELIKKENSPDTYKLRKLSDGTEYEIVKNYYNDHELKIIFQKYAKKMKIKIGKHFWWLIYQVQ
jgi:ubiquinone/menaquinone biosynthesis C-methylase UbiE